jgi:archaemetzincin
LIIQGKDQFQFDNKSLILNSRAAPLDLIIQFARAFFSGCEVELLPTIDFTKNMKYRDINGTRQYLTDGFHEHLSRTRSQRNSRRELLCVAVTMADIYPDESWNFVYGQARPIDGVGVYSFARLDPLFYTTPEKDRKAPLTEEERVIMLRRCVKILLHEIGHLFGLKHCIYYICLMNGANNEKEMDRQTLYLCPVCLRKLYSTLQFDVRRMYEAFVNLCEKYGLEEENIWYRKRLACIRDNTN